MAKASLRIPPTRRLFPRNVAFSLVEVVIALGLISFSLMAIMGLFSVGLQSSRESAEDTNLALMTQQVNAWSRSQAFTNLAGTNHAFFFDATGEWNRDTNGAPALAARADSHYACTINSQTSPVSSNVIYLQYQFEWPLAAPVAKRQHRVVFASRANEN